MKESDIVLHRNIDNKIIELSKEYHHGHDLIRDLKKVKLQLKDRIALQERKSRQLELFREYKRKQDHIVKIDNIKLAKTERRDRKRRKALERKDALYRTHLYNEG
jgi:hypothetical protein|tara:strand:+ start:237 stop:551 length:315 start_codon:yes stop_codon:yes gene_type:complete